MLHDEEAASTFIGRKLREAVRSHPGLSGVYPLRDAHDASAARATLAQTAEKTLDLQYYIWKNDLTGTLMLKTLLDAADRGVRVRLLLDDNGINGLDDFLLALHHHDNIEVRLFNPFPFRWPKRAGLLLNFGRLNRRMHNKSFTADNQLSIVGGRNVGDEYFGAGAGVLFSDLDVLLAGPVVGDISADFNSYWNHQLSVPIQQIVKGDHTTEYNYLLSRASEVEQNPDAKTFVDIIRESGFLKKILNGSLEMQWSPVKLVSDPPSKVLNKTRSKDMLALQLREALGKPQAQILLISSYFVPTKAGVKTFSKMSRDGIDIRILTNSLDATDVKIVHAGYEKRRPAMLKSGIRLFEMKRTADESATGIKEKAGPLGSSGSSLHAKTFAVDGKRLFIGSFNFDPRSIHLNTEMGVVIDSPEFVSEVQSVFESRVPKRAYEVILSNKGSLNWIEQRDGGKTIHNREPNTGPLQLFGIRLLSKLPIEWLL